MDTTPDGRPIPPPHAGERAMLESWLEFHRETLALKCAGLDDDQVRRAAVTPSSMTLLGLVRHLAEVERNWFQRVFAGHDVPLLYGKDGGYGYALDADRGIDEALAAWRTEVDRSRELIADASLDESGTLSKENAAVLGGEGVSLRWILVHMIEEYARHNGHADLLRESIDGVTGA
ncbi:DinB family protein [Streptomyces pristinaespiralis]|uniref:DinB family protein n=1 Tax=Streptomyces pristinaespiralis TaxID=38300 RepID=UPI0033F43DFB